MTLPASHARVLAALRRLSPEWPSTEPDTSVGKELGSIAVALGLAADSTDLIVDEEFPQSATHWIERWEKITRVPTRTADDITVRRARVLSVLRRSSGARLDQLEKMLAGPFDCSVDDIIFVEQTRELIEAGLTETQLPALVLVAATPTAISMGKPWPGVVDDTGVRVYVDLSAYSGACNATLTSPAGTGWTFSVDAVGWHETRTVFLGQAAGGAWTLAITDGLGGQTINEVRLLVSNSVDSGKIYDFFAYRDPSVPGTPDMVEAQRLFHRTALGHMVARVGQSMEMACDDPYSLCDRDLLGV